MRARIVFAALEDVEVEPEEVQQAQSYFAQQQGIDSQEALEAFTSLNLLTIEDLNAQVLQPIRLHKLCQRNFMAKAEARFLERKRDLDRVVYSLLRTKDQGLAREFYLQIASGESNFADLAATYAEGPEKETHGIIGPVPLTQAHPSLVDRLRTAQPGVVLEPFQIQEWWLVVRLQQLIPAVFDQDTADAMSRELFDQWVDEQLEQSLADVRSSWTPKS